MLYYNTMVMMMILLVLLGALLGCRCCADMATMVMVMVMLMIDGTDTDTDTDSAVTAAAAAAHYDDGTANYDGDDDDTAGVAGCIVEVERCATDTATGCSARVAGGHRCPFHVTQVSS